MIRAPEDALKLSSSRWALYIGFGSLIAIIAVSGGDALRVLREYRIADHEIREKYLTRNRLLSDVRSDIYLSGTYVRDYLLEPNPTRAMAFGQSLDDVHKRIETELTSYGRHLGSGEEEERVDYQLLQTDLDSYWGGLRPILEWDPDKRRADGYTFLRDEVYPRRVAMLQVANRIADINESHLKQANAEGEALLDDFRNRTAVTLAAGLLLGLGMAAFSIRRILQLEAHTNARYLEVVEARKQLGNLSARLVEAQEAERRALSRELHDEVGQSLSAVHVELHNLAVGLPARPMEETRKLAEEIKGLVEQTVRVVRNMALLLRPSMLDDLGLIPALRWQAREVSKRTQMDVNVETDLDTESFPDEHATCVYRIVQEALHNCSRHAQASHVDIKVHRKNNSLLLSIHDDGKGFDAEGSKGLGILGMEERAAQLGGVCQVQSAPGQGVTLEVNLPLPENFTKTAKEKNESHPDHVGR